MARLDARCKIRIPVIIVVKGQDGNLESVTSNLGVGGAFINSSFSLPENTHLRLRAPLLGRELEVEGKVLRREDNGVAVKFLEVGEEEKSALWEYIRGNIEKTTCPNCGAAFENESARCSNCGIERDLGQPAYRDKYEEQQVSSWCSLLDLEIDRFLGTMDELEARLLGGIYEHDEILKKTHAAIDEMMAFCVKFEQNVQDRELVAKKQNEFKDKTAYMLCKSWFMNHARIWPQGYQGDYKMLDRIYKNIPLSEGIGSFIDCYFLDYSLSRAVRGRLLKAKEILTQEFLKKKDQSFFDIGCGSSRDLFEMSATIINSDIRVACIDIDEDALRFSMERLTYAGLGDLIQLRKYNVARMINRARNLKEFGAQDIIYSAGVFNYLPDSLILNLLGALYDLLNPGGKMIIAFEDAEQYRRQEVHWLVNWDSFLQRAEPDCRALFSASGFPAVDIRRDETGVIMFCTLEKDGSL